MYLLVLSLKGLLKKPQKTLIFFHVCDPWKNAMEKYLINWKRKFIKNKQKAKQYTLLKKKEAKNKTLFIKSNIKF